MDDTALEAALGEHCLDGIHHAAQSVRAEQIYIAEESYHKITVLAPF